MQTTTDEPKEPIDLRTVPIWAVPQLAYIRDRLGATILSVIPYPGMLAFRVSVPMDNAEYVGKILKADMLDYQHIPPMYDTSY